MRKSYLFLMIPFLAGVQPGCLVPETTLRECESDLECPAARPFCDVGGVLGNRFACVSEDPALVGPRCEVSVDCADVEERPVCNVEAERCVQCLVDNNCTSRNNSDGDVCFPAVDAEDLPSCGCNDHSDCTQTKVCKSVLNTPVNVCAQSDEVVYVAAATGMDADGCGAIGMKCASIREAVTLAGADEKVKFIHVEAGTYSNNLAINLPAADDELHIIGVGRDMVAIRPDVNGSPVVNISGMGTISLQAVEVKDGALGGGSGIVVSGGTLHLSDSIVRDNDGNGIECTGSELGISRSIIRDNAGIGVQTQSNCNLTVEQSEIGNATNLGNKGGGISVMDGTVSLVNNIIADNGSASSVFGGVLLSGTTTGTMEFNTIVDNNKTSSAIPSGIQCNQAGGLSNVSAPNNLVQSNDGNTGPEQVNVGGCLFTFSALDATSAAAPQGQNNIDSICDFNTMTRRLNASDTACVNAADPAATLDVDIDGNPRPSPAGANRDIGAHERQD